MTQNTLSSNAPNAATPAAADMTILGKQARIAARTMRTATGKAKAVALSAMAGRLIEQKEQLIAENSKDLVKARANGLDPAMLDRLMLSEKTIESMAAGLRQI